MLRFNYAYSLLSQPPVDTAEQRWAIAPRGPGDWPLLPPALAAVDRLLVGSRRDPWLTEWRIWHWLSLLHQPAVVEAWPAHWPKATTYWPRRQPLPWQRWQGKPITPAEPAGWVWQRNASVVSDRERVYYRWQLVSDGSQIDVYPDALAAQKYLFGQTLVFAATGWQVELPTLPAGAWTVEIWDWPSQLFWSDWAQREGQLREFDDLIFGTNRDPAYDRWRRWAWQSPWWHWRAAGWLLAFLARWEHLSDASSHGIH